jgi:hypothetical protein
MKKLSLTFISIFLFYSVCLMSAQETSLSNNKVSLSKIEYYFDYIGKPVPSDFKPTSNGSNIYEPSNNHPILGKEIVSLGVKNNIVDRVFVFCIFDNETEYEDWFKKYINDVEKLGFKYGVFSNLLLFAKDQYAFVFKEKNSDKLYSCQIDFFITE